MLYVRSAKHAYRLITSWELRQNTQLEKLITPCKELSVHLTLNINWQTHRRVLNIINDSKLFIQVWITCYLARWSDSSIFSTQTYQSLW